MLRQIGALPYRITPDGAQVMLITSRDTGRWVVPKGNPIRGLSAHEAAAQEAWEEAGLTGLAHAAPIGEYRYVKWRRRGAVEATVSVHALAVLEQATDWPERAERDTCWFALPDAAAAVAESGLAALIAGFDAPPPPARSAGRLPPAALPRRRRLPMPGWVEALLRKRR